MIILRIFAFDSFLDTVLSIEEALDKAILLESVNYHNYEFITLWSYRQEYQDVTGVYEKHFS